MTGIDFNAARGPDGVVVYAIGDVHGRLDLLSAMHARIAEDAARRGGDWRIVHLGDYVDRGPDSRGVLDLLARRTAADGRVMALAGNHDVGFLDFLEYPDPDGLFALFGGVETALSYGVPLDFDDPVAFSLSSRALAAAVPAGHRRFLRGLGRCVDFGDFFFCHAGIRPGVSLDAQDPRDLIWIRGEFHRHEELFPKVVVHGHTPVGEAEVLSNRVNLDTGAFASGRLTALVIDGAHKHLMSVEV